MLSYATTYEIGVGVRSLATGATGTLRYGLHTFEAYLYVLQRASTGPNAGPDDDVVRTVLGSAQGQVVHRAPKIQSFAVADPSIAVITQAGDESAATLTVGPVDGSEPAETVADQAVFTRLRSSGPGGIFGFVRAPPDLDAGYNPQLELYDPVSGELSTVKGLGARS